MAGVFQHLDLTPNPLELARQQAAGGYIDLTSSNPTHQGLRFPPELLQAAAEGYWANRRYEPHPLGQNAARTTIAAYYAARTPSLAISDDAIVITASTSEAYSLLFALLCDPGDNLLAPDVTYPLFEYLAALRGIELRTYTLAEARRWAIDEQSLLAAADERTRGVLLVSPHNPTGAVIQQALPALDLLGLPLICDEVFAPFTYAVANVPPVAALHPTLPVFTLNGISKLFALPDLKLGWIAMNQAAHERYGLRLELINDTFLGASGLAQYMLPQLFATAAPFVSAMVERVRTNLDLGLQLLSASPHIIAQPPDGGYYLFPAIHGWSDEEALALYLLENGLLVHPGFYYGEPQGTHLMLSALTTPEVFAAGIHRLIKLLDPRAVDSSRQ
jgi:alanine-synthesizing transaminase